jgi:hypothetical protein
MWSQEDMKSPSRFLHADSVASVLNLLNRAPEPLLLTVQDASGAVLLRVSVVPDDLPAARAGRRRPAPEESGVWSAQRCRADIGRTLGGSNARLTLAQIRTAFAAAGLDWNAAAVEAELAAMVADGLLDHVADGVRPGYRLVAPALPRTRRQRRADPTGSAN